MVEDGILRINTLATEVLNCKSPKMITCLHSLRRLYLLDEDRWPSSIITKSNKDKFNPLFKISKSARYTDIPLIELATISVYLLNKWPSSGLVKRLVSTIRFLK